jgi:hypothetical protein
MTLRIKDWEKFQHFSDRRPPWVKLYRALLDDLEWHQLEPRAAKVLVMLWLLASENDGFLPEASTLAFRLRTSESEILDVISHLSHWVIQTDIDAISKRNQRDPLETEERQRRERDRPARFAKFWTAYPKKVAKGAAERAFLKVDAVPMETLIAAIKSHCATDQWSREKGRYIPHPATWLNEKRWLDVGQIGDAAEWHETRSGIEARASELGIGQWDEVAEQFPTYKARVMAAHQAEVH